MGGLSDYGKRLRAYEGTGMLRLSDNKELLCQFKIVQVASGHIYAECEMAKPGTFKGFEETIEWLEGRLDDGRGVVIEKPMITGHRMVHAPDEIHQLVTLSCTTLLVASSDASQGPVTFRFALTNFTFVGTRCYTIDRGAVGREWRLELPLMLDGLELIVRPVDEYSSVVRQLKASRGTDVTCEVIVAADSLAREDITVLLVDDICLLMTLARGCRVEWLYYDVVAGNGEVVRSSHRSAIIKPFGTLELVGAEPREDTANFIERSLPELRAKEGSWELRKAILTYNDAKTEGDYLEMRGLKMAVAMEHIKGRYLTAQNRIHILKPEMFNTAKADLVSAVRELLPTLFPTAAKDELGLMASHTQGFNWYPFRRALSELCGEVGLPANSEERGRFVDIRNELVHRASFHSELGTEWEQYSFMMTFIGKILLAILGYDGYYYDWTKKPGWVGKDMEMRVKLELNRGESVVSGD